ncbi:Lytic transglycosylase LysM domain-containing protein [Desulfonema limicola]|uniref:Lytic transglycosylase LysM domain-containing protein n=1 Tax=Desulfonema limicola TaxID=45656 RepID=A0A975GJT0_9BACT|nr:lytic transglycosylase domain-containing protein [Desulfonema limicola]QTA83924.1 Lytic transglycosylase LysM domain-containing protein [Desulfonema limicola]
MKEDNLQNVKKKWIWDINYRLLINIVILSGLLLSIPSVLTLPSPPAIQTKIISVEKSINARFSPDIPDSLFAIPEKLKHQAVFWEKIFTQYKQSEVLIHDNWYLNVVYEVIDLKQTGKKSWEAVRTAKQKYKELLTEMVENLETPDKMTKQVYRLYNLYKNIDEIPLFKIKDAPLRVHAQQGQRSGFKKAIIKSGYYMEHIEKILEEYSIPKELAWLPLIESSFNPHIRSSVGAAGMWQLMPGSGRHYGLTINYLIDERCDPFISTRAAARHLINDFENLKSWPLAITAYNHGLSGINNAVKLLESKNIADIIENYDGPRFKFASRNFYVEFITAVKIAENPKQYFGNFEKKSPLKLEQIKIPDYVTVETLVSYLGIKKSEIQKFNPALLPSVYEPGGYIPKGASLNIPKKKKPDFEKAYALIPENLKHMEIPAPVYHKVRKKQTLSEIAKLHNVPLGSLARFNNIKNTRHIRAGQRLKIPAALESGDETSVSRFKGLPLEFSTVSHRVRRGQTLSDIAKMYGISEKSIARLNKIRDLKKIRAGQVLRIPEG